MKEGDALYNLTHYRSISDAALTVLSAGAALCVGGCTIEVRPLGYKPPVRKVAKKHTTHHRRAASQDTMYVSPAWLQEYHEMEAEHGGYAIADDAKIQHDGDKIRVPRTVLKHFHDLSKTPAEGQTE